MSDQTRVTVVGSCGLDTIATPFGRVEETLGGSVFYIGAIGSLFTPMDIVGVVGTDFPMDQVDFLRDRGATLDGLEIAHGKTFRWEGKYHANINMRDTIRTELGVFADFHPKIPVQATENEYLLLANIDPILQMDVLRQMKNPKVVALDTMNFWITGKRKEVDEIISKVQILILNDEEVSLLTDAPSLLAGARELLDRGPLYVIVKKGEHGSILLGKDGTFFLCPAFPIVHPKDPTGAGDTFAGGLMGYLAATGDTSSFNLRRAMVYGTCSASFTVEDFGVRRLITLNNEELEERFRMFQSMVEF